MSNGIPPTPITPSVPVIPGAPPPSPAPWPRPPWWTGPWPPIPPWGGAWPPYVTPPWSWSPWVWPRSCGPQPWQTNEGTGACDPWSGWVAIGGRSYPLNQQANLGQLARCQGMCPQGWVSGSPGFRGTCGLFTCPWLCRGCQAGWPYDANWRHIGPVKYPASNRWDCNRIRWLGTAAYVDYG